MRRSVLVAIVVLVVGGTAAVALISVSQTSAGGTRVIAAGTPPLAVTSPPQAWRAPGGRLVVTGKALPRERVALLARGVRIGRATAGRGGAFRIEARAPGRSGAYPLTLVAHSRFEEAGVLRVRPVILAAVGDVSFGEGVGVLIGSYGVAYPWRLVGPALRSADIATANLEGAVSTRGLAVAGKEYTFRGPPSALAATARIGGLDVLTVANNHTLDYGPDAFLDTLRVARGNGMATVGGGVNLAAARRPAVIERGGLEIAFLGYSDIRPLGFTAGDAVPGTAPALPELVSADVRAARKHADLVVVWFHWGVERSFQPDSRQRELADAALRAGATVVLGAHTHVLQPIEAHGRSLVAWSLGNFVFTASSPGTQNSGILQTMLGARGVLGYRLKPVTIVDSRPVPRAGRAHTAAAVRR